MKSKYNTPANEHIVVPKMPEEKINLQIESLQHLIQSLSKINAKNLNSSAKEIRRMYPRALEIWTSREFEVMTDAYSEFGRIDKVAELRGILLPFSMTLCAI